MFDSGQMALHHLDFELLVYIGRGPTLLLLPGRFSPAPSLGLSLPRHEHPLIAFEDIASLAINESEFSQDHLTTIQFLHLFEAFVGLKHTQSLQVVFCTIAVVPDVRMSYKNGRDAIVLADLQKSVFKQLFISVFPDLVSISIIFWCSFDSSEVAAKTGY